MASAAPTLPALFVEHQSFWRPWWWLVLTIPAIVGTATFFALRQVPEAPPSVKWVALLSISLMLLLFAVLRLDTHFDAEGVSYRLAPLPWRRVAWANVRRAYVRQYSPLGEYGGWGIKGFSTTNYAYNAAGDQGVQLELTNGHRLLLGTQQPEALRQLLAQLRPDEVSV